MNTEPKESKFYLGLCMAGAVSAGSYTAGVIDFLTEALEEWEKRRGMDGVPTHRVEIPVIGGASAGGMTSIITAAALEQGIAHLDQPDEDLLKEHSENILYHSWVDLTGEDMFTKLLDTSDIGTNEVFSILNSNFIDQVASRVLKPEKPSWQKLPAFISPNLKVFTTLTNLQGFLYDVAFKAGTPNQRQPYYMKIHNDYACFELNDGSVKAENGWMQLSVKQQINVQIAIDAAMATGAFPVGLKSRLLTRELKYVLNNPLQCDREEFNPITSEPYTSLNVDGGMLNNEPFEKVREILTSLTGQTDHTAYQNHQCFESTILMIAPFPSSKPDVISTGQQLLHVLGLTLAAMISQMRAKPAQLVDAMDINCAGQYLIAPSRRVPSDKGNDETIHGDKAIACGSLNGFGGFLNKQFRIHDYFLGRYNCKIFLRDYFTIPEEALEKNEIFKKGYAGLDKTKYRSKVDNTYQIIPVFFEEEPLFPSFKFSSGSNWPVIEWQEIHRFKQALKRRAEAILFNIIELNPLNTFLMWVGSRVLLRRVLTNIVLRKIKKELYEWNLLPESKNVNELIDSNDIN